MPPALVKAHNELDRAVDLAYRPQPFTSEAMRMVFLSELYEKYTAGLLTEKKLKKRGKIKRFDRSVKTGAQAVCLRSSLEFLLK